MPAIRSHKSKSPTNGRSVPLVPPSSSETAEDLTIVDGFNFPTTKEERLAFRTSAGKVVNPHAWAVYDTVRQIPRGKISTYGDIARMISSSTIKSPYFSSEAPTIQKSSPRAVGNALNCQPFAPYIPCHRVVASNMFIGGFHGEWKDSSGDFGSLFSEAGKGEGSHVKRKIEMLAKEGVGVDRKGVIVDESSVRWDGKI